MMLPFRRKKVSIKEAFDNLPTGLCYFNKDGIPVLCNRSMHRLVYAITGNELSHLSVLELALTKQSDQVHKSNGIYYLSDATAWRITSRILQDEDRNSYIEYVASNVTELSHTKEELEKDNARLREMTRQLQRLSSNVATVTREEETLALKMRVHDQMGRSLVTAHKILEQNQTMENVEPILKEWRNTILLLQQAGNAPEQTDALAELTRISDGMIKIITKGSLPEQSDISYLLVTAIRECVTNALRYAHATELYADLSCENGYAQARITNNGTPPDETIQEGGGLSSLRRHIERHGGMMEVTSIPKFVLEVRVPLNLEDDR